MPFPAARGLPARARLSQALPRAASPTSPAAAPCRPDAPAATSGRPGRPACPGTPAAPRPAARSAARRSVAVDRVRRDALGHLDRLADLDDAPARAAWSVLSCGPWSTAGADPRPPSGSAAPSAVRASRAAPDFSSLTVNDSLIVASGKTPTTSPSFSAVVGLAEGRRAGVPVDRDVPHAAHQRAADPVVEDRLLGHEPDQPLGRLGAEAAEDEVEVADVVARQHRPAGRAGCARRPRSRSSGRARGTSSWRRR